MSIYGQPSIYNPVYMPRQSFYQPGTYVPVVQDARIVQGQDNTRAFFGAGALQEVNGDFEAHDATVMPAVTTATQEIEGTMQITQNALTNILYSNDAQYKIYVRTDGPNVDLTGQNVIVAIGDDCLNAATNPAAPTAANPNRVSS